MSCHRRQREEEERREFRESVIADHALVVGVCARHLAGELAPEARAEMDRIRARSQAEIDRLTQ